MVVALAAIGGLCLLYGVMVMTLWSGTSFFVVWFVLGALLFGSAWIAHMGWWEAWPLPLRRLITGMAFVAVAICLITQGLAISCFGAHGEDDLDCIIVLGAQVRESGPSVVLQHRLDAAVEYLDKNPRTHCIVSGGQGSNEPEPEAYSMARYLEEHGIDQARIIIEDKSLNTVGNILESKELIDPENDRIGIVTNNFHVFRATAIARKQGLKHVCGIASYSSPLYLPNNLLRETFGISKDFLFGNL